MTGSLKDFLPIEALAPLLGGLLLWFGFNYLVLAPNVITPRLTEKYYVPACIASVSAGRKAAAERLEKDEKEYVAKLNNWMVEQSAQLKARAGNALQKFFGMYGKEGQAYLQQHGNALGGLVEGGVNSVAPVILEQGQKALTDWRSGRQKEINAARGLQKHADPAAFCTCNVAAAMGDNVELALYTSSLRLLKPKKVRELENGHVFEVECGKAPVV
ncbi:MAG: hypothetical protein J0I99_00305 [Devosia sp.]|uniref:hypothetical protein n=1 Tax=Devosia sp. TaxID=1871048 RepID=UPI001AD2138A|nr:hypothetical protein [Devosia sp.]MBN9314159.1 hypothetical protein [Devosia sp.]